MKFAHLADCHVGAWREPHMRELTVEAFSRAIEICLREKVDFVLIAGDLFHTAIPGIDSIKAVFRNLKRLKKQDIPVYFITGSHDYSPTGKTMLDLIEEAELGINVFRGKVENGTLKLKWTIDQKTGIKLTGILGRANQLDSEIYETIDRAGLEEESGEKIFLFHTSLEELTGDTASYDRAPISLLPNGCRYYAGGHVHVRAEKNIAGKHIVYPGPVFPASFSELEELGTGGFVIVDNWKVRREKIQVKKIISLHIDCTALAPINVSPKILNAVENCEDSIVLLRLSGTMAGKPTDIPWRAIVDELTARGTYGVLRNTVQLVSPQVDRTLISTGTLDDIEDEVLKEQKIDSSFARELMDALASEQQDGEKRQGYEERVTSEAAAVLAKRAR